MGTAVLSPQDCLTSPHDPINHQISEMIYSSASGPRSRRNAFHASVVQRVLPSLASDHARRNLSGVAVNTGLMDLRHGSTGLLPPPDNHSQFRHFSQTRSSPTFFSSRQFSSNISLSIMQSSPCPSPSLPYSSSASSATRNSSSNGKFSTSRSASTGFLTRDLGRENLNPSDGRFPLNVVPSNRLANEPGHKFGTAVAARFSDFKSREGKNQLGGFEDVGDLRKRTYLDFSSRGFLDHDGKKSSGKASVEEEDRILGHLKEIEVKRVGKGRQSERSRTGNSASDKFAGSPPSVTILQRPKTKEAADQLIANFLGKVESFSPLSAVSELEKYIEFKEVPPSLSDVFGVETIKGSESKDNVCSLPIVVSAKNNHSTSPPFFSARVSNVASKRESPRVTKLRRQGSVDGRGVDRIARTPDEAAIEVPICRSEIEADKWFFTAGNERWAGPAYSNSPAPSSLPLPKFSTKVPKTSSSELSPVGALVDTTCGSTSAGKSSAPCRSRSLKLWTPAYEPEGARDVAFATKNLRRILNLDSC